VSPRDDLRLAVGDLLQRPGTRREVSRSITLDELSVAGSSVPSGSTAELDLVVESTADPGTLTVSGRVTAPWEGQCRRCLDPIGGELEAEVHELFARRPIDDEIWPLHGDDIDLGALTREALLLALPLAPLCGDDCQGPAPDDVPAAPVDDRAERGDEHGRPVDPRWAALDQLRFDDEAAE
jgi:uncharacterized protein